MKETAPVKNPTTKSSANTPANNTSINKKLVEILTWLAAFLVCFYIIYFTWVGAEYVFADDVGLGKIDICFAAYTAFGIVRKINNLEKKVVSSING